MTALIGRASERASLRQLLVRQGERLITLTGPGGIGKTRLAITVAADVAEAFGDGARFVDLSSIDDASLVGAAIAAAVDVADNSNEPVLDALTRALRKREVLLVVDNFEHVLGASSILRALHQACPKLAVLVTSRAPLHLAEECEFQVQPLAEFAAMALFAERAAAVRADFNLSEANSAAVAEICTQLDGLPLALELAAARIKVLSAEQIAQRLHDRFSLLTRGADDAPERHRTLRAALDWSYGMLEPRDQALLRRLAVFAGGAAIEAVEALSDELGDQSAVLDGLERLVDQSLVVVREEAGEVRYRLLETIRQYALDRVRAESEEVALRERHLAWHLELAERAEPELSGAQQPLWLARLQREHDNLRAALGWAIGRIDALSALRLGAGIWKFWDVRGHATEGQRWLESALALAGTDVLERSVRTRAQHAAANLALVRGDYPRATALQLANLELHQHAHDRHGQAVSLVKLAEILRSQGEPKRAVERCTQGLTLFREVGDARWCASALNTLGMALVDLRAYPAAREALEESLALFRQVGGARRIGAALSNLGDVACAEGDYSRAEALLIECLTTNAELEDAWASSACLESLGQVACARGEPCRAARLLGAAEAQREVAGVSLPPADRPAHDRVLASLRARLGREALADAWSTGRGVPLAEIVEFAREVVDDCQPAPIGLTLVDSPLTEREREVAHLIARGLTNRQIADELVISKQTADKHVGNILGKLGAASRAQVAVWVVQRGALAA